MNRYLTISNLSKSFGDFIALDNISLDIEEGEFVCFLGPSGCGKTTLLRAIAGLDMQSEGKIVQGLKDISWLPPEKRDFGIVFQSYALFPNLTVRENIAYGLKNRMVGRQFINQRVEELLNLIGLPDSGKKYPSQLSGGQQQRIALARAIATNPGLLLLDEPLSALDARVRLHLRREIKELQRKLGVTTIMVTHDQEEALSMADKIVVMNHGVIEQIGTPEEIYSNPASAFVASFVGTMNFLDSLVVGDGRVQVGEAYLHCDASQSVDTSTAVTLAIRPEDIRVRFNGDATNRLQATVCEIEYLGSFARTELKVSGIVKSVIADFSMNDIRDHNISRGAEMQLDMPKHRLHLFQEGR
jgi:iron(III) transport system ATP-binding protein